MRLLFKILPVLFALTSLAQKIPSNSNQVNAGKRNGKWTITFDANWKEINDASQAVYYRLIEYQQGKPVGKVRDFHSKGLLQWEGQLLSDNPDVNDGLCIWYYENGDRKSEATYKDGLRNGREIIYWQGKKYSEGTYTNEKKNLDWVYYGDDLESHYYAANQDYQNMDSKTAVPRFQKALAHAEKLNAGTSIEKMNILWSLSYAQAEIGQFDDAAAGLATALQISHQVDGKFDQSLIQDAEKMAARILPLPYIFPIKKQESLIKLYSEAARKREAKSWTADPNYYTDLKGALDNSYWSKHLELVQSYFEKIAVVLPPASSQLQSHIKDWAGYTIAQKEYDKIDAIERACEKYLKDKELKNEKDVWYSAAWIINGRLAEAKGQNERAFKCFETARATLQTQNTNHQETFLKSLSYSAELYNKSEKYDAKAAAVFSEFEKWSDSFLEQKGEQYSINLAVVTTYYFNQKDFKQAEAALTKSMKATEAIFGASSSEYAMLKLFMGNLLDQSGQKERAKAYLSDQAKGESAVIEKT